MTIGRRLLALTLLSTATVGCAPSPEPFRTMALVLSRSGTYEMTPVELATIEDATALEGGVAKLIGGARIVIDPEDPLLQTVDSEEGLARAFIKAEGLAPRANYVSQGDVLWPADFHSWNLVTTYYNLEQSFLYFQRVYDGAPTDQLLGTTVHYFPEFILKEQSEEPQRDNALFFSPIQAFAVLPFEQLQAVPLSINLGVMGHEYSHRVFNQKVYGGRSVPDPFVRWIGLTTTTPALNLLRSLDEGLADFHGYGVTCGSAYGCHPRFLVSSFDPATADRRDLSSPNRCMTRALRDSMFSYSIDQFSGQGLQYEVGSVFAAALYQAGASVGKMEVLQKAVIRAYDDPSATAPGLAQLIRQNIDNPDHFSLAKVANAILQHIPDPELKTQACSQFLGRLQIACDKLPCDLLPDCPPQTVAATGCPSINP